METSRWIIFLFIAIALAACSSDSQTPEPPTTTPVVGRITFAGSTTLQPLAHELGQAFKALYPDIELDIAAGGSVVGIQAVHDGTVDIGMASRALKAKEQEGIDQYQVASDVIAVVVNEANSVQDLSLEQLRQIYLGEITHWKGVGGSDQAIVVVVRGKNSGTRGAFDKIALQGQEPTAPDMRTAVTAGDMAAIVASNQNAIGYVGFGNLEPGIKLIAIDGFLPSDDTLRDGSYQLVRPLLLLTGPLTQPLAYMFVDYALSPEGQKIVVMNGWVPVNGSQ